MFFEVKNLQSKVEISCSKNDNNYRDAAQEFELRSIKFKKYIVKLREREGQGVDPGRSLKGHLWMVDGGWWYTFP